MGASRRPAERMDGEAAGPEPQRGPQSTAPWGTTGGTEDRDAPWGATEDSPMDEGSEPTGLPPGRRGERRADAQQFGARPPGERRADQRRPAGREPGVPPPGEPAPPWSPESGRHGFGPVEPTRVPEAGPGGAPDPAPARRSFPDDTPPDDLGDNPLEEQTGMHSEGVIRRD